MPYVNNLNLCRSVLWMLLFFVELGGVVQGLFYQSRKVKVIVVFFEFDHSGVCLWPKGLLKNNGRSSRACLLCVSVRF